MALTARELLEMAWSYLYTGVRPERDYLASGVSASATSLTTTYQAPAIKSGAKLSIDIEDYYVKAVTGATVTVEPGDFGSTAAAHASGAKIQVNAEFTPFEIFREMNNELHALSSPANGLFRANTVTLTSNPAVLGYDLTGVTNVDGIITVLAEAPAMRGWSPVAWRLERNLATADFASGMALFPDGGHPGRDLRVVFRDQFAPLTALANVASTTTGLAESAVELLAMGAALRLAGVAEIDRNLTSSQGNSRRANEVPAGSRVNAIRGLAGMYRQRVVQEANRLKRSYPTRLPRRS